MDAQKKDECLSNVPFYDIEKALHALAQEYCSESVSARIDSFKYLDTEYSKQLDLKICWELCIQSEDEKARREEINAGFGKVTVRMLQDTINGVLQQCGTDCKAIVQQQLLTASPECDYPKMRAEIICKKEGAELMGERQRNITQDEQSDTGW